MGHSIGCPPTTRVMLLGSDQSWGLNLPRKLKEQEASKAGTARNYCVFCFFFFTPTLMILFYG